MASTNRKSFVSSAPESSSTVMKRPKAPVSGKALVAAEMKKRVALRNLTNKSSSERNLARDEENKVINKVIPKPTASQRKRGSVSSYLDAGLRCNSMTSSSILKPVTSDSLATSSLAKPAHIVSKNTASGNSSSLLKYNEYAKDFASSLVPSSSIISPDRFTDSTSLDESMSTCDSMKSPDFEYVDDGEASAVASLERITCKKIHISKTSNFDGCSWRKDIPKAVKFDGIIDLDEGQEDPQLCSAYAPEIYSCLREAELKKQPPGNYMERIQKDINAGMRAILVDWLVEVTEEYRLVPETLYLTANYIDRYLSGNDIERQRLQLLGVACMLIASKYEEICAPQVEEFCYLTDNTYTREEVVQTEAEVLKYLKYEMSAPTTKCFLRRFVRIAQGCDEVPLLQMEFLASYVAELSLLDYSMLCYLPSVISASAVFLSRFILQPAKHPWNPTLGYYTQYQPSDLCKCVKALHHQICYNTGSNLPAIREKYSQHKYKFVAKKFCPPLIPSEYFQNPSKQTFLCLKDSSQGYKNQLNCHNGGII